MCGIAGATGKDSEALVKKMLEAIKHRGPDGSGLSTIGDITLGSVLLKITGSRSQPLRNKGMLTYNGEIYNFREIAGRLRIEADSDSEVLFNLIEAKGAEAAILELDGDYAFAYAKEGKIILARDTVGVKPLYYSPDNFAFASEKKALYAIGSNEIRALKPGHVLTYSAGKISEKKVTGFASGERITDENTASRLLLEALVHAVRKRLYNPCALAFSGGLDSSLIAALCRDAELYSVAMEGSHDIKHAKTAAQLLGLSDKLHLHKLTIEEIESAAPDVIKAIESKEPLKVSIALPLFLASRDAHNDGMRVMLSGQGADELFAGYKRYESLDHEQLGSALKKDLENIAENNLERDDAAAMSNAVELRLPYLDREVVELALRIAPELKLCSGIRKYILRCAAKEILPEELLFKEKKAAQYSSGIYSALERIAGNNGYRGKQALGRYLEGLS